MTRDKLVHSAPFLGLRYECLWHIKISSFWYVRVYSFSKFWIQNMPLQMILKIPLSCLCVTYFQYTTSTTIYASCQEIGIARTTQRVQIITVIEYWGSFVALKTAKDRTTGIVSNFLNPSNLMKVGPQTKVTRKIGLYVIAITKLL